MSEEESKMEAKEILTYKERINLDKEAYRMRHKKTIYGISGAKLDDLLQAGHITEEQYLSIICAPNNWRVENLLTVKIH